MALDSSQDHELTNKVASSWLADYPWMSFERVLGGNTIIETVATGKRYMGDRLCWVVSFDRLKKGPFLAGPLACITYDYSTRLSSVRFAKRNPARAYVRGPGLENESAKRGGLPTHRGPFRMEVRNSLRLYYLDGFSNAVAGIVLGPTSEDC